MGKGSRPLSRTSIDDCTMEWTQFFLEVLSFSLKTGVIVLGFAVVILLITWASLNGKPQPDHIKIENWSEKFKNQKDELLSYTLTDKELKKLKKEEKKALKNASEEKKPNLFVLQFDGDIKASQVEALKNEITAVLSVAQKQDEVLLVLNSPGGVVHGYGLAAAELVRLRNHSIPLTVSLDQIGASGGYMMACTAQKIICSPFAIVGSIGVLSQVPNFHKLLKKNDVDYHEYTAGKHKTTISLLAEITPEKEAKFKEMLEATHELFKNHIKKFRPGLNFDQVATGEYWYGTQALELGLVDEISTSQELLLKKSATHQILFLKIEKKKKLAERIMGAFLGFKNNPLEMMGQAHPWDQIH